MDYIDGFVVPVPTANLDAYRALAETAATVFKEFGALRVVECWGDDVPAGKVTSFPMSVKLEPGETVVFSWIAWASRAARDEGMKQAAADPRLAAAMGTMPFDGQRMIFGGFRTILDR